MTKIEVTQEILKSLLKYSKETGEFIWLVNRRGGRGIKAGDVAGSVRSDGYRRIRLFGVSYYAHRLAFLYVKGRWPKEGFDVDHRDGDTSNNRWKNLREGTVSFNLENLREAKTNGSSGYLGVSLRPSGRFLAQIVVRGVHYYLGTYDTAEEAHKVYLTAKRKYHRGNVL